MQWKPNVTVAAIVWQDDRFLLVEENIDDHIVFNQPAGHLEKNESLIQAIKREVLEETALEFIPESIIGIYLYPSKFAEITYLRICFSGRCTKQHIEQQLDDGILRVVWFTHDEIKTHEERMRSPLVIRCIDDFLSGKSYPLELLNHFLPASQATISG
jgi:ADP-ribose pyrophosphatase YjhB (NUDIX family)